MLSVFILRVVNKVTELNLKHNPVFGEPLLNHSPAGAGWHRTAGAQPRQDDSGLQVERLQGRRKESIWCWHGPPTLQRLHSSPLEDDLFPACRTARTHTAPVKSCRVSGPSITDTIYVWYEQLGSVLSVSVHTTGLGTDFFQDLASAGNSSVNS